MVLIYSEASLGPGKVFNYFLGGYLHPPKKYPQLIDFVALYYDYIQLFVDSKMENYKINSSFICYKGLLVLWLCFLLFVENCL